MFVMRSNVAVSSMDLWLCVLARPEVGNRESSRWAASLLGRSRILFFDICHVSPSSLKVGYTRSAFWHRSLCMGCTMRGSSPLPNRVGWVHSPSFPKSFLRLPIAGPALPQRYASERMDGRKRGWKSQVEKKKGIGGGCCQMCQAYRFIFKRTNTSGNW